MAGLHYLLQTGLGLGFSREVQAAIRAVDRTLPRRIDYIFAGPRNALDSGPIAVHASRVVMQQKVDGVHASDHYGIYTEFLISGP